MKQILFGLVIALMLCTYNVFSEQYSKVATEVTCVYKYSTDVFVDSAGHTTFMDDYTKLKFDNFSLEEPKVGKEDREYRRYASYRLCFKWNLQESIPKNAKVTGVSLELWYSAKTNQPNTNTVELKAKALSLDNFTTDYAKVTYDAIKSGSEYFSHTVYINNDQYTSYQITNFANIQTAIGDSVPFCMAFMTGDDEAWGNTQKYRYLEIKRAYESGKKIVKVKLKIDYYIPYEITVVNSFGSGKINVDGNSNVMHGTKFSWKSTDSISHTLLAYEQEVNGKQYAPTGSWTNLTTGKVIPQNPLTITEWKNATYQANYIASFVQCKIMSIYSSGNLTSIGVASWQKDAGFVSRPNPWTTYFKTDSTYCLKAYQGTLCKEKYNKWIKGSTEENDVTNHHTFHIDSNFPSKLTAQFKSVTDGVTIKTDLLDAPGIFNINIEFKDPWLIDYADPNYGNNLRNQGMSAPFKSVNSTTNNLGLTTPYKGVFLNQYPPTDGSQKPYYTVRAQQEQTINGVKGYFLNWGGTGVDYQNANNRETPVVFKQTGATATALYKGIHASGNQNAFANNSQRKLVRTQDGWLHQVYESAGRVWLEHSTDNGATWFMGNNGKPLDDGEGKCPSIDWGYYHYQADNAGYVDEHIIVIAFQQKYGNGYTIQYAVFSKKYWDNNTYINRTPVGHSTLYTESTDNYTTNANPNIAVEECMSGLYDFLVTFEKKNGSTPGIYWMYGKMSYIGIWPTYNNYAGPIQISGTDANSVNATVHFNKLGTGDYFDVVFQQSSSSIKDVYLYCGYGGANQWYPSQECNPFVISQGTGKKNYNPSMVQMSDLNIQVCWIRDKYADGGAPYYINVVYWNSGNPSVYRTFGSWDVRSVSINMRNDNVKTFFAWSEAASIGSSSSKNCASNGTNSITLNTTGRYVQLSNGPLSGTSTNMVVSSYNTESLPYKFQTSSPIGSQLQKSNEDNITYGRGAVLLGEGIEFNYSLKSFSVEKKNIKFVEIPEHSEPNLQQTKAKDSIIIRNRQIQYLSLDSVNTMLLSEPFEINGAVSFSEDIGFTDTAGAKEALKGGKYISYRIELVEEGTQKVLGVIKQKKITSKEIQPSQLSTYRVKIGNKINSKMARVRIVFETNIEDLRGIMLDEYGTINDKIMAKLGEEELTCEDLAVPSVYALEQNYPNPFNPTTTIKYDLPEAARVTMIVYDIIGREVAKLVDGEIEAGYHTAVFDGSRYASGIYFVRMTAQGTDAKPYIKTMKIVLMK